MTNANPSINPADNDTLTGTFRQVFNKLMQSSDFALPAKIISFDRESNRAQVQPLISILTTSDDVVSRAQISSIPVVQSGGGGYILSFNLKEGDLGWIIASDRDISLFLQSYSEQRPNTFRKHNFSDAVFFPDVMTGYDIDSEDSENAVLQNLDGSVKISLGSDKIKIKAETIEVDGDLVVTGEINAEGNISTESDLNSQNDLNVGGDSNIEGQEIVQGLIASNDDITATGSITPGTPPP
jgi:hypothetical protein